MSGNSRHGSRESSTSALTAAVTCARNAAVSKTTEMRKATNDDTRVYRSAAVRKLNRSFITRRDAGWWGGGRIFVFKIIRFTYEFPKTLYKTPARNSKFPARPYLKHSDRVVFGYIVITDCSNIRSIFSLFRGQFYSRGKTVILSVPSTHEESLYGKRTKIEIVLERDFFGEVTKVTRLG